MRGPEFAGIAKRGGKVSLGCFLDTNLLQTSKLTQTLHRNHSMRLVCMDTELRIGTFAGDKLEKGFVESRNRLAINGMSVGHQDSAKTANMMFDVDSCVGGRIPQIK